jgi:hypothetical protein
MDMALLLGPKPPPSIGLQVFWPLSLDRNLLGFPVFLMNPIDPRVMGPVESLFTSAIIPLVVREVVVLTPVVVLAWLLGRLRALAPSRQGPRRTDMLSLRDIARSDL